MIEFQDYHFTSDGDFAKHVAKAKLSFLYVYEDPSNRSLIEAISTKEPDELYLSVDISKVVPAVRMALLFLSPIDQKAYKRDRRDLPYLQTFITGMGFVGTAFEPQDVEALVSRSRADKVALGAFYERTDGNKEL